MDRDKLRFLTVAFASFLLFSISAHAGPPVPQPPPANILELQNQIDQEVVDRITADDVQQNQLDQLDQDVTDLQDKVDLLPAVLHECIITDRAVNAGILEEDRCLCPDDINHKAIGGGFDMGSMSLYPQVATAKPVDPPCGSAFYLRLYNPYESTITIPSLKLYVFCVEREDPWSECE